MKCDGHEELDRRVTRIETNTNQILIALGRIEERVYEAHGATLANSSAGRTAMKIAGIAAAVGAGIATAINIVAG